MQEKMREKREKEEGKRGEKGREKGRKGEKRKEEKKYHILMLEDPQMHQIAQLLMTNSKTMQLHKNSKFTFLNSSQKVLHFDYSLIPVPLLVIFELNKN